MEVESEVDIELETGVLEKLLELETASQNVSQISLNLRYTTYKLLLN